MVDVERTLKNVINKGKVSIGAKQTKSSILNGTAKLIVIAQNSPYTNEISILATEKKIPVYQYQFNGVELGYACGKNYAVSVFSVLDEGDSNVMQLLVKKRQS